MIVTVRGTSINDVTFGEGSKVFCDWNGGVNTFVTSFMNDPRLQFTQISVNTIVHLKEL